MKCKYKSVDARTGTAVGKEVELSMEDLNKTPYNVFLVKVDEKPKKAKKKDEPVPESKDKPKEGDLE